MNKRTFYMTSACAVSVLLTGSSIVWGQQPPVAVHEKTWELAGLPTRHDEHLNISGIAMNREQTLMVVGSDERSHIQVLTKGGDDGKYELIPNGNIALSEEETEVDIEGIARQGDTVWVVGSHSLKRKRLRIPEELVERNDRKNGELNKQHNHKRIRSVTREPTREWLYQLSVDDEGRVAGHSIARGSLRSIFESHEVLKRFLEIPSKENGIDIEGLAVVRNGENPAMAELLVGLRGPVLRGPYAVVLVVKARKDGSKLDIELEDTHYLALDGRGIRGIAEMTEKEGGYLVLAGPVGDEPISYILYHWNGKDTIPEIDDLQAGNNVSRVCEIPPPSDHPQAKAEGIHFLSEKDGRIRFVVVYDSGPHGAATVFSCPFSRS